MDTITIRISQEEKDLIKQAAKEADLSMSQFIRKAIREYLKI